MTVFVALLRAVNVGGTGMLPMKDLQALAVGLGLLHVRTYIQSGNLLFESSRPEQEIASDLQRALARKTGRPVRVLIRTASALRAILDSNPFRDAKPSQVAVVFLSEPAPKDLMVGLVTPGREQVRLADREIFIHYPDGMGRSKLKLPSLAAEGTARNLNTLVKLVAMTSDQALGG